MKYYDYIIVGSGIAGLYTSLIANQAGAVLILTKGKIDESNTKYAQGGIAAAIGLADSPELHYQDTMSAGAGLCDSEAARVLTEEATDRIADLVRFGVPFDTVNGEVALTKEAAHSLPRILHAGGDATGEQIEVTLSRAARSSKKVTILEDCLVTEIIVQDGEVKGVLTLDCRSGFVESFGCRFLILATGGTGRLFKFTTNSEVATGDGIALAYRSGAEVTDMEFVQFHPTALRLPGVPVFLLSEAMRGEGAVLRNVNGERFMQRYAPEGELAPRDVVARSILFEIQRTRSDHVFLDVTHLLAHKVSTRFPHIYNFCLDHDLDITISPIPVAPAAHYIMGGVKTNIWGESNIAGLFACGETACTGVHGANRLASNSLLEVLVFAKRIVQRTSEGNVPTSGADGALVCSLPNRDTSGTAPTLSVTAIQSLMWEKAGIVRSGEGLSMAADTLAAWQGVLKEPNDRPSYELDDMVLVARLMVEAALLRQESRGAHYRTDFPETSPAWQKHIVFRKDG